MTDEIELNAGERQWLLTIDQSPMTKATAGRVPAAIRDSLIEKQLVQWKYGFLEVALLETTPRGEEQVLRLRSEAAAALINPLLLLKIKPAARPVFAGPRTDRDESQKGPCG